MRTVIHSVKKLRVELMTAKAGSRGHVRWAGRMTSCVMTHDLAMPAGRSSTLLLVSWREPAAARAASRFFFFFFFWRVLESRKPMRNTPLSMQFGCAGYGFRPQAVTHIGARMTIADCMWKLLFARLRVSLPSHDNRTCERKWLFMALLVTSIA